MKLKIIIKIFIEDYKLKKAQQRNAKLNKKIFS